MTRPVKTTGSIRTPSQSLKKAFSKAGKRFTGTVEKSKRHMSEHDEAIKEASEKTGQALKGDRHK